MSYSTLQVNLNGYDQPYSNKDKVAKENVLITDRKQNVSGWKQQIVSDTNKEHPFNDVFKVRWNPFNYLNDDYVVWVDGSVEVKADLLNIIKAMENNKCEFAIVNHPDRNNIFAEYCEWCRIRNYDKKKAFMWLSYMSEQGLDTKHSGLYQSNIMIFKNTPRIREFCSAVWNELHHFDKDNAERLDQTVATFLLKTKFKDVRVLGINGMHSRNCREFTSHWNHPMR